MFNKKQCSAYGLASETATKTQQVVMLYDGIIKFTMLARKAIEEKNIPERFNNLHRASQIVIGLQSALDFEKGEKIAVILNHFYTTMYLRLMGLNQSNSIKDCDEIIDDLKRMRRSWNKVHKTTEHKGAEKNAEASLKESPVSGEILETIAVSI